VAVEAFEAIEMLDLGAGFAGLHRYTAERAMTQRRAMGHVVSTGWKLRSAIIEMRTVRGLINVKTSRFAAQCSYSRNFAGTAGLPLLQFATCGGAP